jgi:hypothetical protein
MRTRLFVFILALIILGCNPQDANQKRAHRNAIWSHYGAQIPNDIQSFPVSHLIEMVESTGTAQGLFEAEIVQSCETIGCWMLVKGAEGKALRVFMKDHAFFIPKDGLKGKSTMFFGQAFHDTASIDLQKQLLRNKGASAEKINAIKEPAFELAFEAAGVMIVDAPEKGTTAKRK